MLWTPRSPMRRSRCCCQTAYAAVNIDRVAKLAGTTRAAIYRRAKTRGELVVGLLVSQFGSTPPATVGSCAAIFSYCSSLQRDFFRTR